MLNQPGSPATGSTPMRCLNSQSAKPVNTRAATSSWAWLMVSAICAARARPLASFFNCWRGVVGLGRAWVVARLAADLAAAWAAGTSGLAAAGPASASVVRIAPADSIAPVDRPARQVDGG